MPFKAANAGAELFAGIDADGNGRLSPGTAFFWRAVIPGAINVYFRISSAVLPAILLLHVSHNPYHPIKYGFRIS